MTNHATLSHSVHRCSHPASKANGMTIAVVTALHPIANTVCNHRYLLTSLWAKMPTKAPPRSKAQTPLHKWGKERSPHWPLHPLGLVRKRPRCLWPIRLGRYVLLPRAAVLSRGQKDPGQRGVGAKDAWLVLGWHILMWYKKTISRCALKLRLLCPLRSERSLHLVQTLPGARQAQQTPNPKDIGTEAQKTAHATTKPPFRQKETPYLFLLCYN